MSLDLELLQCRGPALCQAWWYRTECCPSSGKVGANLSGATVLTWANSAQRKCPTYCSWKLGCSPPLSSFSKPLHDTFSWSISIIDLRFHNRNSWDKIIDRWLMVPKCVHVFLEVYLSVLTGSSQGELVPLQCVWIISLFTQNAYISLYIPSHWIAHLLDLDSSWTSLVI